MISTMKFLMDFLKANLKTQMMAITIILQIAISMVLEKERQIEFTLVRILDQYLKSTMAHQMVRVKVTKMVYYMVLPMETTCLSQCRS